MLSLTEQEYRQELSTLYMDHHGWLHGWLRKKLGCPLTAADLAQDVFVRLLSRRGVVEIREPRAYLSRIAQGMVIDHWRRRQIEQAWMETLALAPESLAPSAEQQAQIIEMLIQIDELLHRLSPRVRTVFLLAQLEGLSCPQIGERLGVSRATVERDLAKALHHCYTFRFADDLS